MSIPYDRHPDLPDSFYEELERWMEDDRLAELRSLPVAELLVRYRKITAISDPGDAISVARLEKVLAEKLGA